MSTRLYIAALMIEDKGLIVEMTATQAIIMGENISCTFHLCKGYHIQRWYRALSLFRLLLTPRFHHRASVSSVTFMFKDVEIMRCR